MSGSGGKGIRGEKASLKSSAPRGKIGRQEVVGERWQGTREREKNVLGKKTAGESERPVRKL